MITKQAVFACAIAAVVGCRSDRNERDVEYTPGPDEEAPGPAPGGGPPPRELGGRASSVGAGGDTDHPTTRDPAGVGAGQTAPSRPATSSGRASVSSGAERAGRTEEAEHTVPDTGANRVDRAGTTNLNTGANVQGRRPLGATRTPGTGPGSKAALDAGVSTGLNETAAGTGTTTNTGTNTENAGTGGTDDPQR